MLWCALNALKTAQENHNITSETGLRHYLLEWLSGASRHPEFSSLPGEIMALKALTEKDRNIPIIGTLNTLFLSSATVGECPLFRFRAALGKLQKAGWRTYVCPWPEMVFNESIERACSGKRHLLQLSRTEECFLPTGDMRAPVTLQLITPLHRKTMQLLETAELIFSDEDSGGERIRTSIRDRTQRNPLSHPIYRAAQLARRCLGCNTGADDYHITLRMCNPRHTPFPVFAACTALPAVSDILSVTTRLCRFSQPVRAVMTVQLLLFPFRKES
nr:hypothetical protein [Escherichia coli]